MTAYEIADELDGRLDLKAANMLRQQADRIAELENDIALKTRDRDVFRDFTLAYEKRIEELEKLEQDFIRVIKQTNPNKPQTKPAHDFNTLTLDTGEKRSLNRLSDEEIESIWLDAYGLKNTNYDDVLKFVRAIEEWYGIK